MNYFSETETEPGMEMLEQIKNAPIQKKFLEERKIFLWGAVMDESAKDIVAKLMYLEMTEPGKLITFYINSPGGVITSGMTIYDTMQMISSPVATVCMGLAASMGSLLLCAGEKGKRYIYPSGKVMIHQPSIGGQIVAPATDIRIHAQEIRKTKDKLNLILAEACNQPLEKIVQDTDRDYYMTAEEAIQYGIVDHLSSSIHVG
ncbi:MAG TPA: ATP-dependent Clp protease proteolytic subunit [Leptospiraceae bacterium]|nr:ATP-dependent Clp protease proteolytic subunit [Leptospiraceae bacterium]HMY67157.1 ATP-dependent Clp protease proteolytic subunit [Leptospiraceae bacterium]HNF15183.1 ATP-dependent Clp protease proteolytic subunit [Leptospiraceae bacterium]HNF26580.1 ATP-dependent Clp protease proteolytic subunit [Leptospiraceae bacterium]HNH08679.1 ATP-dependent Clp protease proteolytic subunit [Leptospiraceae bacterium]